MKRKIPKGFIIWLFAMMFFSCSFWDDNNLGNNFSLLEGDKIEDRLIVYCSGRSLGCCNSGIPVIPSREDTLNLYVIEAKSNKDWIIVKTKSTDKTIKYWAVDKNFKMKPEYDDGGKFYEFIQTRVIGPFEKNEFEKQLKNKNINLEFED
jgi:hypothetical protein